MLVFRRLSGPRLSRIGILVAFWMRVLRLLLFRMFDSVEEVRELVKHAKYPPLGTRGSANNQPILNFQNLPTRVQNEVLNRETMLIPMIETSVADECLAVEGVDGSLIGSNDLCTDFGIPGAI
ncbi:Pyruvate/Phosphoenolpyruvate kinase-like domain-containing protein [Aspergillus undulatus]|uniref:Pyruvate/Phosphoenolpyruvate kinase-like domain-containing protein n=1 Tax=Aspergillus undulatus TaxID=1810928 RepID=UPI003CCE2319